MTSISIRNIVYFVNEIGNLRARSVAHLGPVCYILHITPNIFSLNSCHYAYKNKAVYI